MSRTEKEKDDVIMKGYIRVRKNEIKYFGCILVVCHIYHQMDSRKFIRASCISGLMCFFANTKYTSGYFFLND